MKNRPLCTLAATAALVLATAAPAAAQQSFSVAFRAINNVDTDLDGLGTPLVPAGFDKSDIDSTFQPGFEATYRRQLGEVKPGQWGIRASFNYVNFDFDDTYAFAPAAGTVAGRASLETDSLGVSFGPYLDVDLKGTWDLRLAAGISFTHMDAEFDFQETNTTAPGGVVTARTGKSSEDSVVLGGFLEVGLSNQITEGMKLFGALQLNYMENFDITANGAEADLKINNTLGVILGVEWLF